MCGIAGFTTQDNKEKIISNVQKSLYLRGPDETNFHTDSNISLINTRLKVRDLDQGSQPFSDTEKNFILVYNGELYNHIELKKELTNLGVSFHTSSDTEVVFWSIVKFGKEAFEKFNGMFALAFYDVKKKTLLVARDRFGVKPLYYIKEKEFSFSSQVDSLKIINPYLEIDPNGINNFLSHNYITEDKNIYKEIQTLKAGHYAEYANNHLRIEKYWELNSPTTYQYDTQKLDHLLNSAVTKQLVSDRSIGVFLSSGIDSATIAYYASREIKDLNTYSIGFDNPNFDETHIAKKIAKHLGTKHHSYIFTAEDFKNNLTSFTKNCTTPISDLGMYPLYFLTQKAKETSTVLLIGDGGDEIFAGYATIKASLAHKKLTSLPFTLPGSIFGLMKYFTNNLAKESMSYRIDKFSKGLKFNNDYAHYFWRTVFDDKEKRKLFKTNELLDLTSHSYLEYAKFAQQNNLQIIDQHLYTDFKVWLVQNNFIKVDTSTMSHSIEARVPFLDNDLVQYMFNIYGSTKWNSRPSKHILREVMKDKLPSYVINAQKSSFHPPYIGWFQKELYSFLKENLMESKLVEDLEFDSKYISNLLQDHKSGQKNNSYKLYNLIYLEFWLRSHT